MQGPVGDVEQLCALMGPEHALFGSNLPLHNPESALLSIEHAGITVAQRHLLLCENAQHLFGL